MNRRLKKLAEAHLPTHWGAARIMVFGHSDDDPLPHVALAFEPFDPQKVVNLRIHSECFTGDVLHSLRCECGSQLDKACQYLAQHGGLLIYARQEGRGIGLTNKIRAYALQDQGLNTVEANLRLGFDADMRHYEDVVHILQLLRIDKVNLLTNNPDKVNALERAGIKVIQRIPLLGQTCAHNYRYLMDKKVHLGHIIPLDNNNE